MKTIEIDLVLSTAYHAAAQLAAGEVHRHLAHVNLSRHPLQCHGGILLAGDIPYFELLNNHPAHRALREAGEFVDRLPMPVRRLVGTYL